MGSGVESDRDAASAPVKDEGTIPTWEIWTVADVAAHLHVSDDTVRKAVAAGQIPGYKIGSQWRFNRDVVRALLGSGTTEL